MTPPRPLLVTAPGGTAVRVAVERLARERGWRLANAPADANLLVVAGAGLDVTRVWEAIPAPRVRVDLVAGSDVAGELATAVTALHDVARQRREAAPDATVHMTHADNDNSTRTEHDSHGEHGHHSEHGGHTEQGDHADHGGPVEEGDHSRHDGHTGPSGPADHANQAEPDGHSGPATHTGHSGHSGPATHSSHSGHGGHAGHDMSGMELPGGIAMADRAEDRDGLMLDQLTFPLGPVLPLWPAGLTVHTRLQGDVIQSATVVLLPPGEPFWHNHSLARRLDSCAILLALAGWEDAATAAGTLRDRALAGEPVSIERWARRVRRSRALRWLLTGVGPAPDAPASLQGDALDRLYRWLDTDRLPDHGDTQWAVDHLPTLLTGSELATARLTVASLAIDLDLLGGAS